TARSSRASAPHPITSARGPWSAGRTKGRATDARATVGDRSGLGWSVPRTEGRRTWAAGRPVRPSLVAWSAGRTAAGSTAGETADSPAPAAAVRAELRRGTALVDQASGRLGGQEDLGHEQDPVAEVDPNDLHPGHERIVEDPGGGEATAEQDLRPLDDLVAHAVVEVVVHLFDELVVAESVEVDLFVVGHA